MKPTTVEQDLLADIEACCETVGVSVSRFGIINSGDTAFVHKLRKGRQCLPGTIANARETIATLRAAHRTPSAHPPADGQGAPDFSRSAAPPNNPG